MKARPLVGFHFLLGLRGAVLLLGGLGPTVGAAFPQAPATSQPAPVYWQVQLSVEPSNMPIKGGEALLPIPGDWPEQTVTIRDETATPGLAYQQVDLDEGVRALAIEVPAIPLQEKAELTITFAVTLTPQALPERPQYLRKPPKPGSELTRYLRGSEQIEPRNGAIKKLAAELVADKPNDWERVQALYDWVLANIELAPGKSVGAAKVLAAKKGTREDRVNLFVSLCRNQEVPARFVWADRLEYAEFYLEDEAGLGQWYPCQFAGEREFGSLQKPVLIEQKGDNFQLPNTKDKLRFVVEQAKVQTIRPAKSQADRPHVSFMRRQIFEPQLKPQ